MNKQSAKLFLSDHPDGEGLRKALDDYVLVAIKFAEPIQDLSAQYPESIVDGLKGYVIRTPMKGEIPRSPSRKQIERGAYVPPVSYSPLGPVQSYKPLKVGLTNMATGLLTKQQILDMSKVEVFSAGAFQDNEAFQDQTPVRNGVHDLRMGAFDMNGKRCDTCDLPYSELAGGEGCLGHLHINLTVPIPKLQFLGTQKYEAMGTYPILFSLNTVCHSCSKIMLPQATLDGMEARVKSVFELNKRHYRGHTAVRNRVKAAFEDYHGTKAEDRRPCPHIALASLQVQIQSRKCPVLHKRS